ncbi:hypothetical protein Prudu_122S000200, partial [Prunus dulcis]
NAFDCGLGDRVVEMQMDVWVWPEGAGNGYSDLSTTTTTDDILPSLEDQGVHQLYPKGPNIGLPPSVLTLLLGVNPVRRDRKLTLSISFFELDIRWRKLRIPIFCEASRADSEHGRRRSCKGMPCEDMTLGLTILRWIGTGGISVVKVQSVGKVTSDHLIVRDSDSSIRLLLALELLEL